MSKQAGATVSFRYAGVAAAVAGALVLSACASAPDGSPGRTEASNQMPPVSGASLVTTPYPVLVIGDDDEGAKACLGAIFASVPAQCDGTPLVGWDWSEHEGEYSDEFHRPEGEFFITGWWDPATETLAPTEVGNGRDFDWSTKPEPDDDVDFTTRCPEPAGGWHVLDEATTTDKAMDRVFRRATKLDGYTSSWMDSSLEPDPTPEEIAAMERGESTTSWNKPELMIVNVMVAGDVAAAEAELRKVWGGMLCVTAAERSRREIRAITKEIIEVAPGFITTSGETAGEDIVVTVVYDDGSLQREVDSRYGTGVVRIQSTLVAAS
ncbi:MAG: hypothetical protein QM611_07700 [Microbacterium sp.]|uniref:hypothetical protein n=1 Tax=Microbacterium sp. TaxID=51671 RepID=UPI0039E6B47D